MTWNSGKRSWKPGIQSSGSTSPNTIQKMSGSNQTRSVVGLVRQHLEQDLAGRRVGPEVPVVQVRVEAQPALRRRLAPLVGQLRELAVAVGGLRLADALDHAGRDAQRRRAGVLLAQRLGLVQDLLDRAVAEQRHQRRAGEVVVADRAQAVLVEQRAERLRASGRPGRPRPRPRGSRCRPARRACPAASAASRSRTVNSWMPMRRFGISRSRRPCRWPPPCAHASAGSRPAAATAAAAPAPAARNRRRLMLRDASMTVPPLGSRRTIGPTRAAHAAKRTSAGTYRIPQPRERAGPAPAG